MHHFIIRRSDPVWFHTTSGHPVATVLDPNGAACALVEVPQPAEHPMISEGTWYRFDPRVLGSHFLRIADASGAQHTVTCHGETRPRPVAPKTKTLAVDLSFMVD